MNWQRNDYPAWICKRCGDKYGNRQAGIATWHAGTCDLCGGTALVTEPRDFGGLRQDWRDRVDEAKE